MQIDTAGTYTLKYTAEDACGNVTEVTREVVAEVLSYRTVLYTDGTFIINEKSSDQAANEALHGVATNVYDPFGDTANYIFTWTGQRPWNSQVRYVKTIEIGSKIAPTSTSLWFKDMQNCTNANLLNLDTSKVTNMSNMFDGCIALTSLNVSGFDTSNVTNMGSMFRGCRALTSLDVSGFDTSNVTNMGYIFENCRVLTSLDVSGFDTSNVTNMDSMFSGCFALTSLDVSGFDTSNVTNMHSMFGYCQTLTTIYASLAFAVAQVTDSGSMFLFMSTNLVGGAGTVWSSSNPTDKTYAHIDGGISNPGYFTAKA